MKPVAPVRAIRGLAPTGFTAGLGRSMDAAQQYTAFGACQLGTGAAVRPAMALKVASAPPLSLLPGREPGGARDALPLGQIIADEGGEVLGAAAGHVEALPGQRGDDVGDFAASLEAAARRSMISRAVPAGANRPYQPAVSNPGRPDSETVGRSGATLARRKVLEASATSLPSATNCNTVDAGENITCTRPLNRSVAAWAVPG